MPNSRNAARDGRIGTTPELSWFVAELIQKAVVAPEPSIGDVRSAVMDSGDVYMTRDGELMFRQDRSFLVIELDDLIERHGSGAVLCTEKIAS